MAKMKVVQVSRKGGPFEVAERDIPEPGPGQVRVHVRACGVCHSDLYVKEGLWPGLQYPRCPGHEIAGVVDATGPGAGKWTKGARVGVGWAGGHCGECEPCRRGKFVHCRNGLVTGLGVDGGYAEYALVRKEALAALPDELTFEEAAPLLCAGVTTYNALRHAGARPGDLVAVQGIGGLGHLGIQFAAKMGFAVAAISKGADKEALSRKLGARHYIDHGAQNPAEELQKLGGARAILATAPDSKSISALIDGLGVEGELMVVGASPEPLAISPLQLIPGSRSVRGWASGSSIDSEDTLRFAALAGVRPMIEVFPFERAAEAYEKMLSNKVRFRSVLSRS
jgi:D-arabinose 1-dehydrogenase-like Zn-dependent alcohol dehydrogenase